MQVFKYIAENNTEDAAQFCENNGYYNIYSIGDLANALRNIFIKGEEKAKEVLALHPDKAVILEVFEVQPITPEPEPSVAQRVIPQEIMPCYKNADGGSASTSNITHQTNTFILLGAVIISVAIISLKNK